MQRLAANGRIARSPALTSSSQTVTVFGLGSAFRDYAEVV